MTAFPDASEILLRPIVTAMVRSRGMEEDARARFVMQAFADSLTGSNWFLLHQDTMVLMNNAMLEAQCIMRMQQEELLRLACDGADVDPDLLGEVETMQ